ncbi:reverse transcriptase domain-containing protein [Tanacetum coccineum]
MRTRSSSNLIVESSTIPKRRNHRRSKQIVEPKLQTIVETLVVTMADMHTMSELLQAPTEGYGDAIVIPAILTENFELKVGLLQLTTNLKNDIMNFQQKFDETFSEAWDRFKDLLCKCPHHGFSELHQIDTLYNALTQPDQDSLNAAAGVSTTTSSSSPSPDITALTDIVKELVLMNKANQQASVKAVEENCVTCGRPHPYYECLATNSNTFNAYAATGTYNQGGSGSLPSNTIANLSGDLKAITTQSGVAYDGPTILPTPSPLPKEVECETKAIKDKLDECLAMVDHGASINLMHLFVWKKLLLSELTLTRMTLELVNQSFAYPVGVAEDVFVKVGKFHFPADFVVVDYDVDPRVPLILGRPFLRMTRALIDHRIESVKMINFIDIPYEDNFEEVLKIKKLSHHLSGSTTSTPDSSPSPTPVKTSDSLLEKFVDELALLDPFPSGIGDTDFDAEGDILLLEKLLNDDPSSPLPPKEINFEELKMIKSSIDDFSPLNILGGDFVTFSNHLFAANDDFTFSNDESLLEEDVQKENFNIYSNPLFEFDEEYISSDVNPLFNEELKDIKSNESYVSNLDEPVLSVTPLSDANEDECFNPGGDIDEINAFIDMDVSTVIEDGYHDSKGDEILLEYLLKKIASMDSSLLFSSGSEDIIFDPDIPVFRFYSLEPVDCTDYEDSGAHGFINYSLKLLSLACLYMGIRFPRSL